MLCAGFYELCVAAVLFVNAVNQLCLEVAWGV